MGGTGTSTSICALVAGNGCGNNAIFAPAGPAGIGKTHSIVSAALRRLDLGGNSLVVFGDDFGRDEPWEVLRSKLGFGADVARSTLLQCLLPGLR